jgi:2-iminobutanoate/2-iminopropanoate deaminase
MTKLTREIIQPKNEKLNVSKNFNLPHSPGVKVGDFIYLSGMIAIDPVTGQREADTIAKETHQIMTNMQHMLESAGSSLEKIVKVNVFIYSMLEYDNFNNAYRAFFPKDPPARTVCGVQLSGGAKLEIECVALA